MSISTIASVTENCNAVILSTDVYRKSFWPMMYNQINYLAHLIIQTQVGRFYQRDCTTRHTNPQSKTRQNDTKEMKKHVISGADDVPVNYGPPASSSQSHRHPPQTD